MGQFLFGFCRLSDLLGESKGDLGFERLSVLFLSDLVFPKRPVALLKCLVFLVAFNCQFEAGESDFLLEVFSFVQLEVRRISLQCFEG